MSESPDMHESPDATGEDAGMSERAASEPAAPSSAEPAPAETAAGEGLTIPCPLPEPVATASTYHPAAAHGGQCAPADRTPLGARSAPDRRSRPRRKARPVPPERSRAAALELAGKTDAEIGAQVNRRADVVARWRANPAYQAERERLEADAAAEAVLRRARVHALRTLAKAAEAGDVDASKALMYQSAPPSERQRAEARKAILGALPAALRKQVAEHLDHAERAWLESLSDAELEAIVAAEEP